MTNTTQTSTSTKEIGLISDSSFGWNNAAKTVITTGLNKISSASCLILSAAAIGISSIPAQAQQLPPSVLSEVREAPFSQMFTIQSASVPAYAVKDKDYKPGQSAIGFFSLWGDVPSQNRLGVRVRYCLPSNAIASANTYLAEMVLLDGDKPLVTINKAIAANVAQPKVVQPAEYIPSTYIADPFFDDPFWNPIGFDYGYVPATYILPVDCSAGRAQFDLSSVKNEIAQLPNKTLNVKLIFNNGMTENWHLGGGTVTALKELPNIRQALNNTSKP